MTLQLQQAVNTTDIQEAIDVVTDHIRQNKHQALGRREKLEDETEGKNKDETLESLLKRNAELRSRNKANAAKIAELEARVGDYIKDIKGMDAHYVLDCAHARLALSLALMDAFPTSAEQGASVFRGYLEQWPDTQERLAAVRDLFAECSDPVVRNMSEELLYDLTTIHNTVIQVNVLAIKTVVSIARDILPRYLVYRSVINVINGVMLKLDDESLPLKRRVFGSTVKDVWIDFHKQCLERLLVPIHAKTIRGKAVSCDNVKYAQKANCNLSPRATLLSFTTLQRAMPVTTYFIFIGLARKEHPKIKDSGFIIYIDYTVLPAKFSLKLLSDYERNIPASLDVSSNAEAWNEAFVKRTRENPQNSITSIKLGGALFSTPASDVDPESAQQRDWSATGYIGCHRRFLERWNLGLSGASISW
ncbi:hypothetical protein ARMGADRAFT_1022108 [Armillaria gallica]|uniref:Uncharacterized protein n=1 Tax=Armillaria gallica TaxID=47427 RepID=A0A2H3EY75_ARMGA|nr:hypothetical protein ARMGADRAFT_1022108 [Armillaria gallica]